MRYVSTRGGMAPQAFTDILLEGLAPDGGLAVPETIPQIDAATLESWRTLSYAELAFEILQRFITDIPADDLRRLTQAAYRPEVFGSEAIVPLKPLSGGLTLLGLSEGPTLAFKDMAMQLLGHLFEYVLEQRDSTLNILGATSGDTGSAAEYAMLGKQRVSVFMLSPQGRMSAFQRAQMYSLDEPNIHNIAVSGVFDDCQDIVKAVSGDLTAKGLNIVASIWKPPTQSFGRSALIVRKEFRDKNPNTILAVLAASLEGQNTIWTDSQGSAQRWAQWAQIDVARALPLVTDFQAVGNRSLQWKDEAFVNAQKVIAAVNPDIIDANIADAGDESFLQKLVDNGFYAKINNPATTP